MQPGHRCSREEELEDDAACSKGEGTRRRDELGTGELAK